MGHESIESEWVQRAREHLKILVENQDEVIDVVLASFLAGGHILLEGPPGSGKTSLAKGLAKLFDGSFSRIQLTADLLPSDLIGVLRLDPKTRDFEFRKGPIFTNFLLADELNRTGPKTQSALLEAMAERTVTVDGVTYELPKPFFTIATQNPLESQGVFPLPESQTDRFMAKVQMKYPDSAEKELSIYRHHMGRDGSDASANRKSMLISLDKLQEVKKSIQKDLFVHEDVMDYVTRIIRSTREHEEIESGVSVRGGIQVLKCARALAYMEGRAFVLPADIQYLAPFVFSHRISIRSRKSVSSQEKTFIIEQLVSEVKAPK